MQHNIKWFNSFFNNQKILNKSDAVILIVIVVAAICTAVYIEVQSSPEQNSEWLTRAVEVIPQPSPTVFDRLFQIVSNVFSILFVLGIILGRTWFYSTIVRLVSRSAKHRKRADTKIGLNMKRLIRRSWGVRKSEANTNLALDIGAIPETAEPDVVVRKILDHVRRIAPGLSIPIMTPRIIVEPLTDIAGQFIVEDGWVRISVGSDFFNDLAAAQAILCHEVCHYILETNGIRELNVEDNERLTDMAIFVFGLGDVFLRGYRRRPNIHYRKGHRLGYLNDGEYQHLSEQVSRLWLSGEMQETKEAELERRLKNLVIDPGARKRIMANARKMHPTKSVTELLQLVVDSYDWERR